jgi:transcriptional regulatory protein RtcR
MATLASQHRITVAGVDAEQQRLLRNWATDLAERPARPVPDVLSDAQWAALDEFDRMQLAGVIAVCQQSRTLAEAGRRLFAVSRLEKANPNDSDRLRKYLLKFGLNWDQLQAHTPAP